MKARVRKFMVIMLSLMMIASSFISVSFAEDAPEDSPKAEASETVKESKPEPAKAKPAAPEPVKEKAPEPEPAKESAPEPEPVVEQKSDNGGGAAKESENNNDVSQEDQTPQEELSVDEEEPVIDPGVDQLAAEEEKKEEEEKMPAQSFSGSAGGLNVKASVGKGVFPKDTKMKVSAASSSRVIAATQGLTGDNSEVVDAAAADITFYHDGKEVQPKGSVNVNLRPTSAVDGDTFKMIHISDGGSANVVAGASAGGGSASVSDFSVYGIVGEKYLEGTDVYARYTYNFYIGNELVNSQVVINGEYLKEPTAPNVGEGKFKGWKIDGDGGLLDFSEAVSIPEDAEDEVIKVNAVIEETFYATFWRDAEKKTVLKTKEGAAGTVITTGDVTWKFTDGTGIVGWMLDGAQTDSFELNKNVDLLPIISKDVCTVTFETGEGSPVPTVFVEKGKTVTKPANPSRTGYSFEGWFTDSACTNAFKFTTTVNDNLILHAKWKGANTTYKVVHWKQNANDDGYTFVEMSTVNGNAGTNATYTAKNYTGFTLNAAKTDINTVIKGDGTTIKNVYYDRKLYTLTFTIYKYFYIGGYWENVGSKQFKYEQDTSNFWKEINDKNPDYIWYHGEYSDSIIGDAKPMPAKDMTAYGRKGSGKGRILYIANNEKVNGKDKEIRTRYEFANNDWKFNKDYVAPAIPGFTFDRYSGPKDVKEGKVSILEGKVYYNRNKYAMSFITNGGASVSTISGIPYEASLAGYKPSNYTEGITKKTENGVTYTFTGWYTDETLQQKFNFNSKMPALEVVLQGSDKSTLVLFAGWTAGTHTVSFDLDGGTFNGNSTIASEDVESGKLATAPDSSLMDKSGFVFGGWIDGSGKRFSFDTRIAEDYNLKAIWNSDNSKLLKVAYNETGIADNNEYQEGAYAVIKGQPAAPKGKYFSGWKIGSSNLVLVSGSFKVNAEDAVNDVITLTAQYADIPAYPNSVTYFLNGGNINGNTDNIIENKVIVNGEFVIMPIVPKRDDYTFAGWSTNKNGGGNLFHSGAKVAAGKGTNELYAQWNEIPNTKVKVIIIGAKSEDKVYKGEEQSIKGFDYEVEPASSDGPAIPILRTFKSSAKDSSLKDAVSVTLKESSSAEARGTDAGTYTMNLSPNDFVITPKKGYEVVGEPTIDDGKMTIKPYKLSVAIKGNEKTVPHNGTEQSVEGFTAEAQGNPPQSLNIDAVLNAIKYNGEAKATGTDVGSYDMVLDANKFSNDNKNFEITYEVTNGKLNIEKTIIEEIDPPVDPGDNGEVLPDYRDDRASKKGIRTADISSSEGSSGVNTADSSKLIFYVKILGIAAAILLIVLITRIESRKDNE